MSTPKKEAMPKWERSPDELVSDFAAYIGSIADAVTRKMFGYPAAFVNGQMFAGLFADDMILRLSETDRAAFVEQTGAVLFEPLPGRAMREYVVVPEEVRASPALAHWLEWSARYARSLPPKAAKKRVTKAKAKKSKNARQEVPPRKRSRAKASSKRKRSR
jgi:TfoX/Sxy family transcriptional regulator of competence genes